MSDREVSDEEFAVGLTVRGENVSPAPSHPEEESFTEGNEDAHGTVTPRNLYPQPAGADAFPTPLPSSAHGSSLVSLSPVGQACAFPTQRHFAPSTVGALPSVQNAAWYPSPQCHSAFHPYRLPDAITGITARLPDPNSNFRRLFGMQNTLSMRQETPSTSLGHDMVAEEQKKSTELLAEFERLSAEGERLSAEGERLAAEFERLSAEFERVNLCTPEPVIQELRESEEMEEGAMLLTAAEGDPDYSATTGNEDNSAGAGAVAEDGGGDILLRESSPGISKPLTQSSAATVDLRSMEGDIEDLGCLGTFPLEGYAMGFQRDCLRASGKEKSQSQLPGGSFPGSLSSGQFDCASSSVLGSNLADPSAEMHAAAAVEAAPPDTGQSAEDDDDLQWGLCKICFDRLWKLVYIPCGHGTCKRCYRRLVDMTCPFCRKRILKIVEVLLA